MHGHLRPFRRLGAIADDQIVDPELERDVPVGLVDLRTFECHVGTLSATA